MTCTHCIQAEQALWHGFGAGCWECSARALAHSPAYHDAATAEALTPAYRDALQSAFGQRWKEGHQLVKYWAKKLKEQQ